MMERIVLRPTRRSMLAQRVNHIVPAVTLLLAAIEGLGGAHHKSLWLTAIEVLVGGGLLLVLVRDLRRGENARHARVSLFDVVAAAVIFLEAVHRYNPAKGFQPATMYFVIAGATLLIGLLHHRLAGWVRAELDDAGFSVRTRPFRPLRMAWGDVAALERIGDKLVVRTVSGRKAKADLRGCANRDEVFAAIERGLAEYRGALPRVASENASPVAVAGANPPAVA
jgi:hypothetical protein